MDNEADHIMIKLKLHKGEKRITTNAMVNSVATENFIDQQFCIQHQFLVKRLNQPRDIFVIDGKSSSVGPITHEAIIALDIGSHREQIRFQVANLKIHEAILGMPRLNRHNPTINSDKEQISFNSQRCTEVCLKEPPVVKAIPEKEAIRENLKTKVVDVYLDKIQVRKIKQDAKIPSKESERAAGRNLYANENSVVPPKGRRLIGTGISLGLPEGTYSRLAPRSRLALHTRLTTGAGVIDANYTGEIKVLLMNTSDDEYRIQKGDRIAQIIIERINESEWKEKLELPATERADKGFGSRGEPAKPIEINFMTARAFGRMYKKAKKSKNQMGILRINTNDKEITIASATISTELAIAEKRTRDEQQIRNLVPREYHDYITLFEEEERKDLPPHPCKDHKIELDLTKGVPNKKLYPMKEKYLEELRDNLRKSLSRGWIRESDSPVGAPILFVKKERPKSKTMC